MNKISCIKGGRIILENEILQNKAIVFGGKIIDILDEDIFALKYSNQKINITDVCGQYISPGFIDIHIHGAGGSDTMDLKISALQTISASVAKGGVTAFLPTTMTMQKEKIYKALDNIRYAMSEEAIGAKIIGAHMEGPFISEKYAGAQKKDFILKPDFNLIEEHLDLIKIITLAPEEDEDFKFIKKVKESSDIVLSMGHTNADCETALEAINAGVNNATHIFNAMPQLHHRALGPLGATLKSDISYELIADTIHIHPFIFQILLNAKGADKMILVTDSMRAAYTKEGVWELGGQKVIVKNNCARLENGKLAGSVLSMNKAVFNILKHTDLNICQAVALASINPARLLNIDEAKGSIKTGKDADLIVFDDELNVCLAISEGKIIYKS